MTPRPRVAVVSDFSLATLGGAETAYREQVKALSTRFEVLALCPASPELDELGHLDHVTAIGLPVIFRVPKLGFPVTRNNARLRTAVAAALDAHPVEVIHLHSEFGIGAATHDVAAQRDLPVVQTVHCWLQTNWPIQRLLAAGAPLFHRWSTGLAQPRGDFAARRGDSALRAMTVAVARQADRIIAPSRHIGDDLIAAGLGPVDVIPNAMALPPSGDPLDRIEGPLRVFWFGRCVGEKRLLPFVQSAIEAIGQLGPGKLRIDIAGDGEHLARARALAAKVPDIHLHGRISPQQVSEELARCHVTALTSIGFDNQPMMIVESISALRGVIHTDPRLREGLDTGAGIPAFGDPSVLTNLLVRLARDPAPVVEASRAAVDAREEFSAATFVRRAESSYLAAITDSPRSTTGTARSANAARFTTGAARSTTGAPRSATQPLSPTNTQQQAPTTPHKTPPDADKSPAHRSLEGDTEGVVGLPLNHQPVDRIVPEGAER